MKLVKILVPLLSLAVILGACSNAGNDKKAAQPAKPAATTVKLDNKYDFNGTSISDIKVAVEKKDSTHAKATVSFKFKNDRPAVTLPMSVFTFDFIQDDKSISDIDNVDSNKYGNSHAKVHQGFSQIITYKYNYDPSKPARLDFVPNDAGLQTQSINFQLKAKA